MGDINFLDYDKISDTLMYFCQEISLKFCVGLSRKDKLGNIVHFHNEYKYENSKLNKTSLSIKRNINPYFMIDDSTNFDNSIMIRVSDIILLRMVMEKITIPWFIGVNRIFGFDKEKKLQIKGKWTPADFVLSDYKYISFAPIVIVYENGSTKEGVRMTVNDKSNYVDMDINRFLEFYYYITNTDVYNAAIGLLNYVKQGPYGVNLTDMNNNSYRDTDWGNNEYKSNAKNYFDTI